MCLNLTDINLAIGDVTPMLHPNGGMIDIDDDGSPSDEDIIFPDNENIDTCIIGVVVTVILVRTLSRKQMCSHNLLIIGPLSEIRNEPCNRGGESSSSIPEDPDVLSIFKQTGRPLAKMSLRYLFTKEYYAAHIYILFNCPKITTTYLK
ncbi:hypothetical protein SASPL_108837 [Salvia splendens]|uniref:Uncharacterized protein n=1 Tax=Salvia splendens TaxID=180675 RepID=A0A8X8YG09_SALSN|nr:hypothetical protein SASPL_108837 [Salvia splendens]